MPRTSKQTRKTAKTQNDVGILVGLIRTMAEQSTKACAMFQKNGSTFAQHTTPKNAEYVARAVGSDWYKKHGRLHWVHSVFPPLAYPVRDADGDWVTLGLQSLKQSWDALQRDGMVTQDFRAVTDAATQAGVVKASWSRAGGRSYLSYAVAADLPTLTRESAESKPKLASSDLFKLIRQNM